MLSSAVRIFGSFLVVGACYTAYAAVIVPWIEPSRPLIDRPDPGDVPVPQSEKLYAMLANWFTPGDWELSQPNVFQTKQGMLLFADYQPRDNGFVEIKPCTMVFLSSEPGLDEDERVRRAVVMQAPQGALLRFDPPLDMKQTRMGRLVGGELLGEVNVRSGQRLPGPEDDLHIVTRDVVMSETDATTPHRIDFRVGSHYGHGQGMHARLASAVVDGNTEVRGLQAFTLERQIFFHLQPTSGGDVFPDAAPTAPPQANVAAATLPPPVEVRCGGPFTFDFLENSALFRRDVDIQRLHAAGDRDTVTGDQMKIFFVEGETGTGAAPKAGGSKKLTPTRMEIVGEPVVIRAPTSALQARAQFVEHDVATREIHLRDAAEVIVRRAEHELRAPELFLTPDPSGGSGSFRAVGPGSFAGRSPDDPAQSLTASWSSHVHFRPHEDRRVLSVYGDAHVEATAKGKLTGDEIHVWLNEVPKADAPPPRAGEKPATEYLADRLLALGNVTIDSPQLVGAVARLEAWFEYERGASGGPGGNVRRAGFRGEPLPVAAAQQPIEFASLPAPNAAPPRTIAGPQPAAAPVAAPPRQFRIDGDLLRLQMTVAGKEAHVREAVVERNVKLIEVNPQTPQERPLLIQGDRLHVVQPRPTETFVDVTGAPAYVEARDLTISGGKLTLHRPTPDVNHMAVAGQGVLTMPVDRDLQGKPTPSSETLHLSWQGGMKFDGQTAEFDRGVEGRLTAQFLRTDRLRVTFDQPVAASQNSPAAKPQIRHVHCFDGVFIESRTAAADGGAAAVDRIAARTLSLDQQTGDFSAEGPGEVTSVRRGAAGKPTLPGQPAAEPQAAPGAAPTTTINYLNVRFHQNVVGNQPRREMTFHNQVQTLYGPVADWAATIDPDHPATWQSSTVMVKCDQMQVFARSDVQTGLDSYDLVAEGNTQVEGTNFFANAPRLTYAQAKDLLVIEGDGRTDAKLYHQDRIGGPRSDTSARKFMIWPSTNRVQIDGAAFLELSPN